MEFLIFFITGMLLFVLTFYYMVLIFEFSEWLDKCETSVDVLLLFMPMGIIVMIAKQKIQEIELIEKNKRKKGF